MPLAGGPVFALLEPDSNITNVQQDRFAAWKSTMVVQLPRVDTTIDNRIVCHLSGGSVIREGLLGLAPKLAYFLHIFSLFFGRTRALLLRPC